MNEERVAVEVERLTLEGWRQLGYVDLSSLRRTIRTLVADYLRADDDPAPRNLARLPNADRIFNDMVAAVRREFRRQRADFVRYVEAAGVFKRALGDDEMSGWTPDFNPAELVDPFRQAYNAGGQAAIDSLEISGDFALTSDTLKRQVDQLLLDQIVGIDETTENGIRKILSEGGKTIGELGQEIADFWDQRTLSGGITIAATEMARASYKAELDTYAHNGVEYARIAGGFVGDICDQYVDQIYRIEDAYGIVPIHPRCTHYAEPVLRSDYEIPGNPWLGQQLWEEDLADEGE